MPKKGTRKALLEERDTRVARQYDWVLRGAWEFFGVNLMDKNKKGSNRRDAEYVKARRMAMAFLMEYDGRLTLKQIGKVFGGKDHATVIHNRNEHLATMSLSNIPTYAPYKTEYIRFVKFMYAYSPFEQSEPLFSPERLKGYAWYI